MRNEKGKLSEGVMRYVMQQMAWSLGYEASRFANIQKRAGNWRLSEWAHWGKFLELRSLTSVIRPALKPGGELRDDFEQGMRCGRK